jgi:hypothetical protein
VQPLPPAARLDPCEFQRIIPATIRWFSAHRPSDRLLAMREFQRIDPATIR